MRDVLRLVRPGQAALAVVLGALTVLSGAGLLAASGALITAAAGRPENLLVLMPLITSVRLFGLARAALRYTERLISHDLTFRVLTRIRAHLLERLVPLAPAALLGRRGGDLLARLRSDVDELQGVVVRLFAPAAVALVAGTAAVVLVAFVSGPLAVVLAGLLLVLGVLVPVWAGRAGRASATAAARAEAAAGTEVLDLVRGLTDHLTGDGAAGALRALDAAAERQERAERTAARVLAVTTWLRETVPALGLVAALALVGRDVAVGDTPPVLLAAASLGVLGAFEAVAGLGAAWAASGAITAAARRLGDLDALRPAVVDPVRPLPLPTGSALAFEGVHLTYPGATVPAVAGVDLALAAGEKVALTGRSGSGKSSLLALAVRSWDPDAGRVTLDGVDVRDLALADLRAAVTWTAQSPGILGGTLAGNLRLARDGLDDAALGAALHEVGLGAVVDAIGLHGWIGESGERLSAGERGRLALARALLGTGRVLLLDEPTAHLDAVSARELLARVAATDRTVLLVTHSTEHLGPGWRVVGQPASSSSATTAPVGTSERTVSMVSAVSADRSSR